MERDGLNNKGRPQISLPSIIHHGKTSRVKKLKSDYERVSSSAIVRMEHTWYFRFFGIQSNFH